MVGELFVTRGRKETGTPPMVGATWGAPGEILRLRSLGAAAEPVGPPRFRGA